MKQGAPYMLLHSASSPRTANLRGSSEHSFFDLGRISTESSMGIFREICETREVDGWRAYSSVKQRPEGAITRGWVEQVSHLPETLMARGSHSCLFLDLLRQPLPVCVRTLAVWFSLLGIGSALTFGQQVSPPQPQAQSHESVKILEPGTPVETEIAPAQTTSFTVELARGEYARIAVECRQVDVTITITLVDPLGSKISRESADLESPRVQAEIVASASGRYGIELQNRSREAQTQSCKLEMALPRQASEKESVLQQARELYFKATSLSDTGKVDEALEPAQKAMELREKMLGSDDASVGDTAFILARIFERKSDFPKSEAWYSRALEIQEKTTGSNSRKVWRTLNNLGAVYQRADELDKSENALKRAISVCEKAYGYDHPFLAATLINLANVYDEKGDYINALQMYQRAVQLADKNPVNLYDASAIALANISGVYAEMGDYANAQAFGQRAVAVVEKAAGPESEGLEYPLLSLGDAYRFDGQLEQAEPLYERALKIIDKIQGPDDPLLADALTYLADIYEERGEFGKAEANFRRSLAIRETKLGDAHSKVGDSLDALGSLSLRQGDYGRAEELFQRALEVRQKALGPEDSEVVDSLTHLSQLHMAKGDFSGAEEFLSRAIAISEKIADVNLRYGSERQKLGYLSLFSSQLDQAFTLNAALSFQLPRARDLAATALLQRKGRVHDVLADNLKSLRQHLGPQDVKLLDEFEGVTSSLARLVLGGTADDSAGDYPKKVNELKEKRESLEAEISTRSTEFRAVEQPVSLESVRAALPSDSVLLEFATYRKFLPQGITDKTRLGEGNYAVAVIRPAGDVQWSELGESQTIDDAVAEYRAALRDPARTDVAQLSRSLDQKIFQPLRESIGKASHLLISPDGQLSLIPFESLRDPQGHFEVENYSITYLSTGRDLLRMQTPRTSSSGPTLIADPDFGEPGRTLIAQNSRVQKPAGPARRSTVVSDDLSGLYFAPLLGTALEVRAIQSFFPEAKVLVGEQATKGALQSVIAPVILHIATHGFFLRDPRENSWTTQKSTTRTGHDSAKIENALLRSGLALAGANGKKGAEGEGILTALEASNLNLWGTKLVTLSACDTGMGEVKNGEGVFGLRRAFFLAGTESLVMSLWPVSDLVTRELMTQYYAGLKKGLGRSEALRHVQLTWLKRTGRKHPFYWASFIQAGEWANLDGKR